MKVTKKKEAQGRPQTRRGGYTVWINNVACHCPTLATAERMVRGLRRQGRDIFICTALGEAMDESASEAAGSTPKRRTGRLLRFPVIVTSSRKERLKQPIDAPPDCIRLLGFKH